MPTNIDSYFFTDNFGNTETFYKSNAGDKTTLLFNISTQIQISSVGNPFTFDPTLNIVTSPAKSWVDEGFRPGDWVRATIWNAGGITVHTFVTQIVSVDDTYCDFTDMGYWYDLTAGQGMTFKAVTDVGGLTNKQRGELEVSFNMIKNSLPVVLVL